MFKCESCQKTVGPRISPVVSAQVRAKSYIVKREVELLGEVEDIVMGSEIVREYKLCPTCAGVKFPMPQGTEIPGRDVIHAKAAGFQAHARNCSGYKSVKDSEGKKIGERPCPVCEQSREFFHSLPLGILNEELSDRPAVAVRVTMVNAMAEGMYNRTKHQSKRSGADFLEAFRVLKPYAQQVGAIA
jgi:hypothetical protein